ncbi:MAG: hypothetical protein IJ695_09955 [Butyrivibrio sp.]|nr:hypothetical protein [Butyrivibrio sp.]
MNAEQYKRTNNTYYFLGLSVIASGLVLLLVSPNILPMSKLISGLCAVLSCAISSFGNFSFSTGKRGAFYVSGAGTIYSVILFLLTGNSFYIALSLPLIIFGIIYVNLKLCRFEAVILFSGFVLSLVFSFISGSSIDISHLFPFVLILLAAVSSITSTRLCSAIREENRYGEPEIRLPSSGDEVLDLDIMMDDDDEIGSGETDEKEEYGYDDNEKRDDADDDELSDDDRMPSTIYIPQSEPGEEKPKILPFAAPSGSRPESSIQDEPVPDPVPSEIEKLSVDMVGLIEKSHEQFYVLNGKLLELVLRINRMTTADDRDAAFSDAEKEGSPSNLESISEETEKVSESAKKLLDASRQSIKANSASSEVHSKLTEINTLFKENNSLSKDSATALSGKIETISQYLSALTEVGKEAELISLNASIESARAGEAGRGFASVAGQVRDFGARAGEVSSQIQEAISSLSLNIDSLSLSADTDEKLIERQKGELDSAITITSSIENSLRGLSEGFEGIDASVANIRSSLLLAKNDMESLGSEIKEQYEKDFAFFKEDYGAKTSEALQATREMSKELEAYKALLSDISELAQKLKELHDNH